VAYQFVLWDDVKNKMKRASASVPDYRAGGKVVTINSTSSAVIFSSNLPNTNYTVLCTWMNKVDPFPQFQPIVITAMGVSGFTASWNVPIDSLNYVLNWQAIAYS
jgi:hypothetical protein